VIVYVVSLGKPFFPQTAVMALARASAAFSRTFTFVTEVLFIQAGSLRRFSSTGGGVSLLRHLFAFRLAFDHEHRLERPRIGIDELEKLAKVHVVCPGVGVLSGIRPGSESRIPPLLLVFARAGGHRQTDGAAARLAIDAGIPDHVMGLIPDQDLDAFNEDLTRLGGNKRISAKADFRGYKMASSLLYAIVQQIQ
jgi:hypothetical protein